MGSQKDNPNLPALAKAQLQKRGVRSCANSRPTIRPMKEKMAVEKMLKRGQYLWAVAGDINTGGVGGVFGLWPCICIVDNGDEVDVPYTADGRRGTVPRAILVVEPVDGMGILAGSVAVNTDQHMGDMKDNSTPAPRGKRGCTVQKKKRTTAKTTTAAAAVQAVDGANTVWRIAQQHQPNRNNSKRTHPRAPRKLTVTPVPLDHHADQEVPEQLGDAPLGDRQSDLDRAGQEVPGEQGAGVLT